MICPVFHVPDLNGLKLVIRLEALSRTVDTFGNRIEYEYDRDCASDGPHRWDQLYLKRVRNDRGRHLPHRCSLTRNRQLRGKSETVRNRRIVLKNSSNTQRSPDLSNIVSTHREVTLFCKR